MLIYNAMLNIEQRQVGACSAAAVQLPALPQHNTPLPCAVLLYRDSHSKTMYRALQCFLLDFWNHKECEVGPDSNAVQQLYNLPAAPGQSKCFHLIGQGGGRVCMLHVVLGEYLVANPSLPSGGVLPLLHEKFASKKDIFYINFGVW